MIKIGVLKLVEFVLYFILFKIDFVPTLIGILLNFIENLIEKLLNGAKLKEECNMKKSNNKGLSLILYMGILYWAN